MVNRTRVGSGNSPHVHCMCDSSLSMLSEGLMTSSESLFGEKASDMVWLWKIRKRLRCRRLLRGASQTLSTYMLVHTIMGKCIKWNRGSNKRTFDWGSRVRRKNPPAFVVFRVLFAFVYPLLKDHSINTDAFIWRSCLAVITVITVQKMCNYTIWDAP